MRKSMRFLQGAILGGILGSIAVILLAPESGENTRVEITNRFTHILKQIQTEINQRKAELQAEFERYSKV